MSAKHNVARPLGRGGWQCDQMARYFFQYFDIPLKLTKLGSKVGRILTNHKKLPKTFRICQKGGVKPNVVTLVAGLLAVGSCAQRHAWTSPRMNPVIFTGL